MAQAICNNHGQVEAVWKEGTAKATGKAYAFWGCPKTSKDANGNFIRCKLELANTPSGKFDQELEKSGTQNDVYEKDRKVTRLAIIKSLIESGYKRGIDALTEFKWWMELAEGRNPLAAAPEVPAAPAAPAVSEKEDEIRLEDIPF